MFLSRICLRRVQGGCGLSVMANVANDIQYQQIPERRFRYADIVHKPMHVPVIARIMGQCVVLHCPTDIHHASDTKRYQLWYQKEYRRCSRVLAQQGNARAKRTLKNTSQRRTNGRKRNGRGRRTASPASLMVCWKICWIPTVTSLEKLERSTILINALNAAVAAFSVFVFL